MKKAAFEPFKFGQSKTQKQSYFPAVDRQWGTSRVSEARPAKKMRAAVQASNGTRSGEK